MKQCVWCGISIVEEEESLELRIFHIAGKECLYFCDRDCLLGYINDRKEKTLSTLWKDGTKVGSVIVEGDTD